MQKIFLLLSYFQIFFLIEPKTYEYQKVCLIIQKFFFINIKQFEPKSEFKYIFNFQLQFHTVDPVYHDSDLILKLSHQGEDKTYNLSDAKNIFLEEIELYNDEIGDFACISTENMKTNPLTYIERRSYYKKPGFEYFNLKIEDIEKIKHILFKFKFRIEAENKNIFISTNTYYNYIDLKLLEFKLNTSPPININYYSNYDKINPEIYSFKDILKIYFKSLNSNDLTINGTKYSKENIINKISEHKNPLSEKKLSSKDNKTKLETSKNSGDPLRTKKTLHPDISVDGNIHDLSKKKIVEKNPKDQKKSNIKEYLKKSNDADDSTEREIIKPKESFFSNKNIIIIIIVLVIGGILLYKYQGRKER